MSNQDRDNKIALYFAYRGYVYSLMHLVFSGKPTQEILNNVHSDKTFDMIDFFIKLNQAGIAQGGVSADEQSDDAIRKLKNFLDKESSMDAENCITELCAEYTRLFLVPGPGFVYPWESPHITTSKMMLQETTLDVRNYYHAAGLRLRSEKHFPDDHIAAMMDYMGRMSQRVYSAFVEGSDSEVIEDLKTQKIFAEKHIANWDKLFAEGIEGKAQNSLYAVFSAAMVAIVDLDIKCIPSVIEELCHS